MSSPLDRIVFVLVQPLYPGNVGAAARAMRNCGLSRLIIVDPPAYDPERARWMAPGAKDLLANATIVPDLDTALQGVHRVVASTARHRKDGQAVLEPRDLAAEVCNDDDDLVTAVLFGREDHGLDTPSVQRAEAIVRIPTVHHASLNLSQAVLLIGHELFQEARLHGQRAPGREIGGSHNTRTTHALDRRNERSRADMEQIEDAVGDWVGLLQRVGYTRSAPVDKVATTARGMLQRMQPAKREASALRGMVRRIQWALDNPGLDPTVSRRKREQGDES